MATNIGDKPRDPMALNGQYSDAASAKLQTGGVPAKAGAVPNEPAVVLVTQSPATVLKDSTPAKLAIEPSKCQGALTALWRDGLEKPFFSMKAGFHEANAAFYNTLGQWTHFFEKQTGMRDGTVGEWVQYLEKNLGLRPGEISNAAAAELANAQLANAKGVDPNRSTLDAVLSYAYRGLGQAPLGIMEAQAVGLPALGAVTGGAHAIERTDGDSAAVAKGVTLGVANGLLMSRFLGGINELKLPQRYTAAGLAFVGQSLAIELQKPLGERDYAKVVSDTIVGLSLTSTRLEGKTFKEAFSEIQAANSRGEYAKDLARYKTQIDKVAGELRREVENSVDAASYTNGRATGTRTPGSVARPAQRTQLPRMPIGGLKQIVAEQPGVTDVKTVGNRVSFKTPEGSFVATLDSSQQAVVKAASPSLGAESPTAGALARQVAGAWEVSAQRAAVTPVGKLVAELPGAKIVGYQGGVVNFDTAQGQFMAYPKDNGNGLISVMSRSGDALKTTPAEAALARSLSQVAARQDPALASQWIERVVSNLGTKYSIAEELHGLGYTRLDSGVWQHENGTTLVLPRKGELRSQPPLYSQQRDALARALRSRTDFGFLDNVPVGGHVPGLPNVVRGSDGSFIYRSFEEFGALIRGAGDASRLLGKPISMDPESPARGVTVETPAKGEVIVRVGQGHGARVVEWLRDGRYSNKDNVTVVDAGKTVAVFRPATVAEQAALKTTWSQIAELTKAGKLGDGKPFVDEPRPGFHDEWTTLHPTKRVPGALADWVISKRVEFLQRTGRLPAEVAGERETKQKLLGPVREHIEYGKPIDEPFLQNEIDRAFMAPKADLKAPALSATPVVQPPKAEASAASSSSQGRMTPTQAFGELIQDPRLLAAFRFASHPNEGGNAATMAHVLDTWRTQPLAWSNARSSLWLWAGESRFTEAQWDTLRTAVAKIDALPSNPTLAEVDAAYAGIKMLKSLMPPAR